MASEFRKDAISADPNASKLRMPSARHWEGFALKF